MITRQRGIRFAGRVSCTAMLVGGGAVAAADVVLEALRSQRPEVVWRKPVVQGDFTTDGIGDSAVLGVSDQAVFVATIVGPIRSGADTIYSSWPIGQDGIDASCVAKAALSKEPVAIPTRLGDSERDDAGPHRKPKHGLKLVLPPCATLHLYWNPASRWFSWWREDEERP